jgi:uncharacterized Ntn-hydrolase superfamily protein
MLLPQKGTMKMDTGDTGMGDTARERLLATFSIAARDQATGMLGVAVTSKAFSVGMLCPFARAGVGAVATQSLVNPSLGPAILDRLAAGLDPEAALAAALERDPRPERRQLNVTDALGRSATFTGGGCIPWCGGRRGRDYALAGNILTGEAVAAAMEQAFNDLAGRPFAERLLGVLDAGQAAGGDARGRQSAALLVVHRTAVPFLRLQVEDHPEPLAELRRLYGVATAPDEDGDVYLDFMARVAEREGWAEPIDDAVLDAEIAAARERLATGGEGAHGPAPAGK